MVARAGLLDALELGRELLLGEERGAVDAREHRPARVAAPVGARDGLELDGADAAGARRVRPAAEIREGAVAVERHRVDALGLDEILDQLDLVVLLLGAKALERLVDRGLAAVELLGRGDVLAHPLLDRREVGLGDGDAVREVEVVVEAVLDRRADRDLHARVQIGHRGGQHVRRVVTNQVERVLPALRRDDLERDPVLQRAREVADLAVDLDGQRGAREAGADRGGGVSAARAVRKVEQRAVGEGDVHRRRCYASGTGRRPDGGAQGRITPPSSSVT